jgi:hypothetical protein
MITLAELRTKLQTHGTTATAKTTDIGYLEDLALLRGQKNKDDYYPIILIAPPKDLLLTELDYEEYEISLQISVIYLYDRDAQDQNQAFSAKLLVRTQAWDSATTILKSFITAINGDPNISVVHDTEPFEVERFPEGQTLENSVALQTTIKIKLFCDV